MFYSNIQKLFFLMIKKDLMLLYSITWKITLILPQPPRRSVRFTISTILEDLDQL